MIKVGNEVRERMMKGEKRKHYGTQHLSPKPGGPSEVRLSYVGCARGEGICRNNPGSLARLEVLKYHNHGFGSPRGSVTNLAQVTEMRLCQIIEDGVDNKVCRILEAVSSSVSDHYFRA